MMWQDQRQVACILLAAGTSKRMGRNKLLLPFPQQSIIETAMQELMPFVFREKVVVVSPHSPIQKMAPDFGFRSIVNSNFEKGIHSSIRTGMENTTADYYLIALGDQPHLKQKHYQSFFAAFEVQKKMGRKIFRPTVMGAPGNPCIIHNDFKAEILSKADTDTGCQYLFQNHKKFAYYFETPEKAFIQDIDTQEDYHSCAI